MGTPNPSDWEEEKRKSIDKLNQELNQQIKTALQRRGRRGRTGGIEQQNDNCWSFAVFNLLWHQKTWAVLPISKKWQNVIKKLNGKLKGAEVQIDYGDEIWETYERLIRKHWGRQESTRNIFGNHGFADCFLAAILSTSEERAATPLGCMQYPSGTTIPHLLSKIEETIDLIDSETEIVKIELLEGSEIQAHEISESLKETRGLIGAIARHVTGNAGGHFTCFAGGEWHDSANDNVLATNHITHLYILAKKG